MSTESIYLPITVDYVGHWGVWEAVREILQNAFDQGNEEVIFEEGALVITTKGSTLGRASLLLGNSTKREDDSKIGCYGEGYKLALLVLKRSGCNVTIYDNGTMLQPTFEKHPQIGEEVLTINVTEGLTYLDMDCVKFHISGLTSDEIEEIKSKTLFGKPEGVVAEFQGSYIFEKSGSNDEEVLSKLYVGGLFVCDLPEAFTYSYNFAPNILELDRDRSSVSTFHLGLEAINVLLLSGNIELLVKLCTDGIADFGDYGTPYAEQEHKDVNGFQVKVGEISVKYFKDTYGENAFPICWEWSQGKINAYSDIARSRGLTPIIIKESLYRMLPSSLKVLEFIPRPVHGKASDVLGGFLETHGKFLKAQPKRYLKELILKCQLGGN